MTSTYPQVRRRPPRTKLLDPHRNSDVVRASVLETALELGFSQNSTVANWIFNNPLSEEAEELHNEQDNQVNFESNPEHAPDVTEVITPTLTSGSTSISDESSLNSPGNCAPSAVITTIQVHSHKPSVTEPPHVHFGDFSSDQLQLFSPLILSPRDTHHPGTRSNSVVKLLGNNDRSRNQDGKLRHNPIHADRSPGPTDAGYTSEGQYLSKVKVSKGKDKVGKPKGNKGSKFRTVNPGKTSEKDRDYASDGGYLSASSNKSQGKSPGKVKSRAMAFFRRRPKKSADGSDDEDEDDVPPVPALPILPRPSSPKPLERRAAPSSPTRSGFSPLTLNLTTPPTSPTRRRVSKSPPLVQTTFAASQQSDCTTEPQGPPSSLPTSASTPVVLTPAATTATFALPPSMPGTPRSTASFPTGSPTSIQLSAGVPKSLTTSSSRQHLSIPPPAPPPSLPLPRPPSSPSVSPSRLLPPQPVTPTTPSRKGAPTRPIPVVSMIPGSTRPLAPHRTASPFRPILSPRALSTSVSQARVGDFLNAPKGDQSDGKEAAGRQRSATALSGSTPAFLQRKIQHPPSPRHPPPDVPLPPSPYPTPSTRPRTPVGLPSKFHEHFSSVSSVPLSQVLPTPASLSPSPSIVALSELSSGPSIRSSHISSVSGRSEEPVTREALNIPEYSRPTTSASTFSESSYGHPVASTFGRRTMDFNSHFAHQNDSSSSVYSSTMHHGNGSLITFDDDGDDGDVDDAGPKSSVDEDDDASVYPSDDKTAGRRTMYLVEHGELDENADEVVIAGGRYWGSRDVPPVPPLPPMPTRPGAGYF